MTTQHLDWLVDNLEIAVTLRYWPDVNVVIVRSADDQFVIDSGKAAGTFYFQIRPNIVSRSRKIEAFHFLICRNVVTAERLTDFTAK